MLRLHTTCSKNPVILTTFESFDREIQFRQVRSSGLQVEAFHIPNWEQGKMWSRPYFYLFDTGGYKFSACWLGGGSGSILEETGKARATAFLCFLCVDESTLPPDTRVFVKFILRVIDQNQTKAAHFEFKTDNHFGPTCLVWGAQKFISLPKLNDPRKGFLVDDTCIIEANVTLLGTVTTAS
ncbi:hypothetical protein Acr_17g0001780 [Actinidia rufa]|uniref:MATH domain-containing protein n=1 Tax=Actinidia rufa TaxID=165716 RepID=A0A7J0G1F5_9ERIC|nr:hypothetical protein Acr_17g0001780 [Actinidia rufa]